MNALPRHRLAHPDGRYILVYGSLADDARLGSAPLDAAGIHKRFDLLTREWVAISPARNLRPLDSAPHVVEGSCPLCPGGVELPFAYDSVVLENRFPSFMFDPPPASPGAEPSYGRCEVIVYTSRHDVSFGGMSAAETARVVAMWTDRSRELWSDDRHALVLVFENRGGEAGATLAHPHGQIYAFDHLPPRAAARAQAHRAYRAEHAACLGCALVDDAATRTILANESFAVAVPYAPHWPYEVAVRARRHGLRRLTDLTPSEQADLANALRAVACRLDVLFDRQTPYLMAAQEAPREQHDWHLAFEFLPLLRSTNAAKIRASVETATGLFLNDVLPEDAARRLASLDATVDPVFLDDLVGVETTECG